MNPDPTITPGPTLEERLDLRLLGHRILLLDGTLDDAVAARVCAQLLLLAAEDPTAATGIYLSSETGSSAAATRVAATMAVLPTPVTTVALGPVAGPAVLVLAAGAVGSRCALPGAVVTVRAGGSAGLGLGLDARQRTTRAEEADRSLPALLAERTGLPLEEVERDLRDGLRLTASEAVTRGVVDLVLSDVRAVTPDRIAGAA